MSMSMSIPSAVTAKNPAHYSMKKTQDATIITYDNPMMKDEEMTYTFNKDGSMTRVSNAWGTKKSMPAGTWIDDGKPMNAAEMAQEFDAYSKYLDEKKLNIVA